MKLMSDFTLMMQLYVPVEADDNSKIIIIIIKLKKNWCHLLAF